MKKYLMLFAFFAFGLFLVSCSDDDDDENPQPQIENDYLVEYEFIRTISTTEATIAFNSSEATQSLVGSVATNANLYKITYKTEFKGDDINASALVAIPTGSDDYPIVSFQNGSNTLHSEAPTVNPTNTLYAALMYTSTTGFVVAIPDYIGYGVSSDITPHPYFHKESAINTVTDMLKAIKELPNNIEMEGSISKDLFLAGYSLGGWATLANHYELMNSDDFTLKASACGGGIYDLVTGSLSTKALTEYSNPYFMAFLAKSFKSLGLFPNPITAFFNEPYASRIDNLFDGSLSPIEINAQLTTTVADLLNADFISSTATTPEYAESYAALQANSVAGFSTDVPVRFYHGAADTAIPAQSSQLMAAAMIQAGSSSDNAQYIPLDALGHTDAIVPASVAAFTWFISLK